MSATRTKRTPRASETSGPAIATRNSAPAPRNDPLNLATPPKSQSEIPSISIPSRRATRACPNSCRRIERKKRNAATIAIAMCVPFDRSGLVEGKIPAASVQTISAKTTSQLQFTPNSMPAIRPRRIVLPMLQVSQTTQAGSGRGPACGTWSISPWQPKQTLSSEASDLQTCPPSAPAKTRARQHPPQIDDQLPIDILAMRATKHLGLAPQRDHQVPVGLFDHVPDRLEQRPHLTPLDIAARGVVEQPLHRVALTAPKLTGHDRARTDG